MNLRQVYDIYTTYTYVHMFVVFIRCAILKYILFALVLFDLDLI